MDAFPNLNDCMTSTTPDIHHTMWMSGVVDVWRRAIDSDNLVLKNAFHSFNLMCNALQKVVSAPIVVSWKDFYPWAFYISAFHSSRLLTCPRAFATTLSLSQSLNSSTCYKTPNAKFNYTFWSHTFHFPTWYLEQIKNKLARLKAMPVSKFCQPTAKNGTLRCFLWCAT